MIYRKSTKELLAESVLELSKEKSIDKITIREIVENCGMTSGTFYNHFKDKYDLIAWIYLYQVEEMTLDYLNRKESWYSSLVELLSMLKEDQSFYKNVLKNTTGQNSFFEATHIRSIELMQDVVRKRKGKDLTQEELFEINFYMKGFGYCVEEWIVKEVAYSEEELAGYLSRSIPDGLQAYLL